MERKEDKENGQGKRGIKRKEWRQGEKLGIEEESGKETEREKGIERKE